MPKREEFSAERICMEPFYKECVLVHSFVSNSLQSPEQQPKNILSRQEYWSGLPFSNPGDLPDPGIKTASVVSTALAGGFFILTHLGSPEGFANWRIWSTFL